MPIEDRCRVALGVVEYSLERETQIVDKIYIHRAEVEVVAHITEAHTYRGVVGKEITHIGANRECAAFDIEVAENVKQPQILRGEFAIRHCETECPLFFGHKQIVEQSAVVSAEVLSGDNNICGVAIDDHSAQPVFESREYSVGSLDKFGQVAAIQPRDIGEFIDSAHRECRDNCQNKE